VLQDHSKESPEGKTPLKKDGIFTFSDEIKVLFSRLYQSYDK